jgi:hypothetical protein
MAIKKEPEKPSFPYGEFPILIMHKEGKELKDTKKCYFQSMHYADKYIVRSSFKEKDYQLFIKPGTNVETMVPSTRRKSKQKKP